ncbi:hypothetical protein [Rhodococcus opacus]|uniref:hypothetical protein n=1 Tax=Rhodococcus opacus TaxID=37919 RepID=UPI000A63AB79|nr:hypothetical protein [Rhodococcus opacus]CAG7634511.1 hypothetical protein E143388_07612 [Rhodococcus opacus]
MVSVRALTRPHCAPREGCRPSRSPVCHIVRGLAEVDLRVDTMTLRGEGNARPADEWRELGPAAETASG